MGIGWEGGRITDLHEIDLYVKPAPTKLLLPRLIEPHTHLDKAFTWSRFPNFDGTYQAAFISNMKELKVRNALEVRERVERSLAIALKNGLRAIRTHIDSIGPNQDQIWDVLKKIKLKWSPFIELQLVALAPLEYWNTDGGEDFARDLIDVKGLIGGVLVPPFKERSAKHLLKRMLQLANKYGCGVDLHIDESQVHPAVGLKQLLKVLKLVELEIPITCSHSSSMGLLPPKALRSLAKNIAKHDLNVVALPLTNAWLLGRNPRETPFKRPFAPVFQLQEAGVVVAIGGDNVQDAWFPGGNLDPISLMAFSLPLTQLAPWQRLGLAPFTTSAAKVLGLEWDGTFKIGSPADFVLLDANSWVEALKHPPARRIMIKGKWLDSGTIPYYLS